MTSSGSSTKRLLQEWRQVGAQGPGLNVASLGPRSAESLFRWVALVQGPQDSPYAGGLFSIDIQIPPGYPLAPPVMTFTTPVCHPNIHWKVCLAMSVGCLPKNPKHKCMGRPGKSVWMFSSQTHGPRPGLLLHSVKRFSNSSRYASLHLFTIYCSMYSN